MAERRGGRGERNRRKEIDIRIVKKKPSALAGQKLARDHLLKMEVKVGTT